MDLIDKLFRFDDELAHGWKTAGPAVWAAMLAGQLERVIYLLNRTHTDVPPIASSLAYTLGQTQTIYTATFKQHLVMTGLSASAATTVTVNVTHKSISVLAQPIYVVALPAGGQPLTPFHEFTLPEGAVLSVTSSAAATVDVNCTIYDATEVSTLENFMM